MEEKKQRRPAAYRVPEAVELDFKEFAKEARARSPKAFEGLLAGAALLRFMLDDDGTQRAFIGLATLYVRGDHKKLRGVKLDVGRIGEKVGFAPSVQPPVPVKKKRKKRATG